MGKAVSLLSKRINEAFLSVYMDLDKICCVKFGIVSGGANLDGDKIVLASLEIEKKEDMKMF